VRAYWNNLVATFNSYDKVTNPKPLFNTGKEFSDVFVYAKEVSAASLQQKFRDFSQFKNQFFNKKRKKKIGRPSFKKKGFGDSFRLPNQKIRIKDNKIRLEKIGWVKFDNHRQLPVDSRVLSITVKKDSVGDYFASVCFEYVWKPKINRMNIIESKKEVSTIKPNVGIDLGLTYLAILSDGTVFLNPKYLRESQSKLKKSQRILSRKIKGSVRWNRQRIKVAKLHRKIVRQRDWSHHNITTWIADNYNNVGIETLSIQNMMKNRKLSKSFADTSLSKFVNMLIYKVDDRGNEVVRLGTFVPSTKECSSCSHQQTVALSERTFKCECCGFAMDRDLNAAINIKKKTVGVNAVIANGDKRTLSNKKSLHPNVGVKQL